jgi:RNA polymerase sigma-70 factor (ECF subfamily)
VVDAFLLAARNGEFDELVAILHPDVILRVDFGPSRPGASRIVRGAAAVARQARLGANPAALLHPALINGTAGVVVTLDGRPHLVMAFTVVDDQVVELDLIADPERVRRVASAVLGGA